MAKWFTNLKNGNERVRSASESGPPPRSKSAFSRDSLNKGHPRKDGGVGGVGALLVLGRNRKNSAVELGRNSSGAPTGSVWDTLAPGKGRKNSKAVDTMGPDENRQPRTTSSLAHAYISRMIKVDKQDKKPKTVNKDKMVPENEREKPADNKTTTVSWTELPLN